MKDDNMNVNERIFNLIEEKGITRYRLAKDIGVSEGLIFDWKNGKCNPTTDKLIKLAKYFNVSIDYLVGLTNKPISLEVQSVFEQLSPDEQNEVLQMAYNKFPKLNK